MIATPSDVDTSYTGNMVRVRRNPYHITIWRSSTLSSPTASYDNSEDNGITLTATEKPKPEVPTCNHNMRVPQLRCRNIPKQPKPKPNFQTRRLHRWMMKKHTR